MNYRKHMGYIIVALCLPFLIWALWGQKPGGKYTLAHDVMMDTYHGNIIKIFANNVEMDTKGSVRIDVSNVEKTLGPTDKIQKAVSKGDYSFGLIFLQDLGHEDPIFAMDSLPHLVKDYEQARILWDVTRPHIVKGLKARGLVYLLSVPCCPQGLFLDRTLENPERLKKMPLYSYGTSVTEYLSLLGAQPVVLRGTENSKAFGSKKIRGFFGARHTAYKSEASQYAPHHYQLKYGLPKYVVVMNEEHFMKLSPRSQQSLLMKAQTAEDIAWRMSQTDHFRHRQFFTIHPIPEWLQEKSNVIAAQMLKDWVMRAGSVGKRLLNEYHNGLRSQLIPVPEFLRNL